MASLNHICIEKGKALFTSSALLALICRLRFVADQKEIVSRLDTDLAQLNSRLCTYRLASMLSNFQKARSLIGDELHRYRQSATSWQSTEGKKEDLAIKVHYKSDLESKTLF